jgi:hypothetical protein
MANTYLSRASYGTPTSTKIFTFSCWVKKAKIGSGRIFDFYSAPFSYGNGLFFTGSDQLGLGSGDTGNGRIITNRVFRDTSAWYHIVAVQDTTNATASDRLKLYVNGERETSFSASVDAVLNAEYQAFRSDVGGIGTYYDKSTSSEFFDGEMSHVHFIDGTVYDASAFGEYDANGVWKIITEPSVTYGTNGFFILKNGNSVTDQSGNSNNFTVGGGTLTNTEDNPSNVFATMNPLFNPDPSNPLGSISNGNLSFTTNSTSLSSMGVTTFGASSGKYYAEIKLTGESGSGEAFAGIGYDIYENATSSFNAESSFMWNVCSNGDAKFGGSAQGVGNWSNTYTTNDIISIALDLDNNRVYFAKNGQYADGSGNWDESFTGSPAYATITADKSYFFCAGDKSSSQTASWSCNFGNPPYTISSGNSDGNGMGNFEYSVPSGYYALNTKNLAEYG